MSKNYQRCIFEGHVCRDPETRFTQSNKQVCNFSVACNDGKKGHDGREGVMFYNVTAWDKLAEICASYVHKGTHVLVEGTPSMEKWTSKEGQAKERMIVTAKEVRLLSSKSDAPSQSAPPPSTRQPQAAAPAEEWPSDQDPPDDKEIPF